MADFYGSPEIRWDRFPDWALGRHAWMTWFERGLWREGNPEALDELIGTLRTIRMTMAVPPCPRVFVSHRQPDTAEALRIARLANQAGWSFWLDVLDPGLAAANANPQLNPAQALLIASIIEMGLLNCTHVVAAFTPNSKGSLWIPYEYGRVKEHVLRSTQAGMWVHPKVPNADIPEYALLGVGMRTEANLSWWFAAELAGWQQTCPGGNGSDWQVAEPPDLPV